MTAKAQANKTIDLPSVIRTSGGLRAALFDELDRLRNGKSTPTVANSVAKVADQICKTVYMELDAQKLRARLPKDNEPLAKPSLGMNLVE